MQSYLEALRGLLVNKVVQEYESSLVFSGGKATLTTSTAFSMLDGSNLRSLQGSKVEKAEESEDTATLYFSDGRQLRIDLRDKTREGPEALVLHRAGEPIVVWN